MEDVSDLELQDKISLYLSSSEGDDSGDGNLNDSLGNSGGRGDVLSEDEFLGNDVLLAVSKFQDGKSANSMKRNRRNFKITNFKEDENGGGGGSNNNYSTSPPTQTYLYVPQQPISPISKSPSSSFIISNSGVSSPLQKSPSGHVVTTPSTGNKVPLYQTSPYKASALSPNTSNKVDDSAPQTIGKYQLLHHIGQGYFGNTYSGSLPDSSEYVSIKIIDKNRVNNLTQSILANDFTILKNFKNGGIVKYLNMVVDNNGIGIVQEFIEQGSLYDIYKRNGGTGLGESLLGKYVTQILETLSVLHQSGSGIIHRNLKANNIIVGKGGKCKISDFSIGCTQVNTDSTLRYGLLAQPYWMAPEILSMKSFNNKVDSWGIGVLILECLTGHPPYFDINEPMQALIEIINLEQPVPIPNLPTMSKDLKLFLDQCFKKNPIERSSVQELLKHPWLQSSQSPLSQNDLANTASNNLSTTNLLSTNPNRRSDTPLPLNLDQYLALSEQNEKEINENLQIPQSASKIDFMKFEFQTYHSFINDNSISDRAKVEKLKMVVDNNQTIGNNLKYQMQDSIQEQQKLIDLCENMKGKLQEILDQNKTGARISAHSNLLLKRTNQMASELVRKNENLQINIKRLEDYFINKDECAKKLATVVYRHKVSFESLINPTLATNLQYQIGSKTLKKGQEKKGLATLKDNFLFFFKNEKASVPSDVVYVNDRKHFSTQIIQDQKKKSYILTIGTTIFENSEADLLLAGDQNIDNVDQSSNNNTSNINNSSNDNSSNNNTNNNNNINTSSTSSTSSNTGTNIEQNVNNNSGTNKDGVPNLPSFNSMSSIPTTVVWCLLIFDNQKNMENWLSVLDSVIPWYDKKPSEISGKSMVFEKKHQKTKSTDGATSSNIVVAKKGGSAIGDDLNWRKESGSGIVKFQGIFGFKIDDLMSREPSGSELPYFLTKMLQFLERHLSEEGILRVSGSSLEIQEIKAALQKGEAIDYTVDRDPHAVTGVLKLFLRELPEPIIAQESLRNQSNDILSSQRLSDKDKVREIIYLLNQSMPKSSYFLLKHIIYYAKRVIEHSDQNKMGLANVTTCFAPSLRIAPGLFSMLIQNYEQCFFSKIN